MAKEKKIIFPGGQIPGWPTMKDCCPLKEECTSNCLSTWTCPLACQERESRVYGRIIPKRLEVGDLIYNHRKWICVVLEITKEYVTVFARHYGELTYKWEDVEPIRLTEDIIKKLGWEEIDRESEDYVRGITSGKQFKHPDYTKTLNIRENALTNMYWTINGEVYITYLHDLQHVLRMTVADEIKMEDLKDLE